MRIKTALIVLFASSFIIIFNSCNKCHTKNKGELKITNADLSILPYAGNEVLVYKDSIGDSICFSPEKYRETLTSKHHYTEWDQGHCEPDYYVTEMNYTSFKGSNSDNKMDFSLYFYDPFDEVENKQINIALFYKDTEKWEFYCNYRFSDGRIMENNPNIGNHLLEFNDTLTVGFRKYDSVYTLIQTVFPSSYKNLKYVYYTTSKGVVGFKTENGHLWSLPPIVYLP